MKTKILNWILALSILMMLVPMPASANIPDDSGTAGENIQWYYYETEEPTLEIRGSGNMDSWSTPSSIPWYHYNKRIQKIYIGSNISTISERAFINCVQLREVKLGKNILSIGTNAFSGASQLTSITIPENVITIGRNAFYNCESLNEVTIQGLNTDINPTAFSGTTMISTVYYVGSVDDWDMNDYSEIFPDAEVYFNYLDESDNTDDTNENCGDNARWTLDDDGTLTISGTGEIYNYDCYSEDDYSPIERNYAPWVSQADKIRNIVISEGIINIGAFAFSGLDKLESVTLPASIEYMMDGTFSDSHINDLYINNLDAWCNIAFSDSESNPMKFTENIYIDNELTTSITIPDTITIITPYTFSTNSDTNLYEIIISDSVTIIDRFAFGVCRSVTNIYIPDSVTVISEYAFSDCNNLESITIPDSVSYLPPEAFTHCFNLREVHLPDNLSWMGDRVFLNCMSLESITIPNGMTLIDEMTFCNCYNMTSITIPNSIESIEQYAFDNCTGLETVYYNGTEDEWNSISVRTGNDYLLNANIVFTATEEPDIPAIPDEPDEPTIPAVPVTPPSGGSGGGGIDDVPYPDSLWISDIEASSGDSVTVYISGGERVLTALGSFLINYDDTMLTLTGYEFLGTLSNLSTAANPNYAGTNKFYASFMNTQNVLLDGNMLALHFDVNTWVQDDTYIPIYFENVNLYYETEEPTCTPFVNGGIHVLNYTVGDVNQDGIIDLRDALRTLQYDAGLRTLSNSAMKAADVNYDNCVNILDALLIQSHCAQLETIF